MNTANIYYMQFKSLELKKKTLHILKDPEKEYF